MDPLARRIDVRQATRNSYIAAVLAIAVHFALLAVQLSKEPEVYYRGTELDVVLQLNDSEPLVEKPAHEVMEPSFSDVAPPDVAPPSIEIELKTKLDKPKESKAPAIKLSTNSESFLRFVERETKEYGQRNRDGVLRFDQTFTPVVEEPLPELRYEDAQGMLGGGNYKVRFGDVTCKRLTMVPLTFDDYVQGTSTTYGECEQDEKIKIDIHRLNK